MIIVRSVILFILAGIAEIGGGYLVWQWLRENKSIYFAIFGSLVLIIYGFIPPFQPTHFGRAYAAYGGVFIVLSLFWSAAVDKINPDRFDVLGAAFCLSGVMIMMYWPR